MKSHELTGLNTGQVTDHYNLDGHTHLQRAVIRDRGWRAAELGEGLCYGAAVSFYEPIASEGQY